MMLLSVTLSTLALAATTLAAPFITVKNKCDFDVFVTSVGREDRGTTKVPRNNTWREEEYFQGVGTAIKITRTKAGLWTAKPVLHLSYTYKKGEGIYYDLSSAYGFDFGGQKITVKEDGGRNVPTIEWDGEPQPNHTRFYKGETGLTLEVCATRNL
jgi:hypothetical protein